MIRRAAHLVRRGFTVVEVILALSISVILLAAAQSLVVLSSRSIPNGRTSGYAAVTAGISLDAFQMDIRAATMILQSGATYVEMRVPDRDGDGLQETVRYEWSGTSGASVLRKVTLSTIGTTSSETLVANVASATFVHDEIPASAFRSGTQPETLIASYDPPATLTTQAIATTNQICQSITVVLPPNAVNYNVTRVAIKMSVSGANNNGKAQVILTVPLLGLINLVSLGSTIVNEDTVGSTSAWYYFPLSASSPLAVSSLTALTVKMNANSPCMGVDLQLSGAPAGAGTMTRTSSGLLWVSGGGNVMPYRVYGTFTTLANLSAANAPRYGGCTLKLMTVGSSGKAMEVAARCLNQPEAP